MIDIPSKPNSVQERAGFHQGVQKLEMAQSFLRALYELSENCDFEDIRKRLVVSIHDKELSRRLKVMTDLTMETAVQMVRQAEDNAQQIGQQEQ